MRPHVHAGLNSCCLPSVGVGCLVNVAIGLAAFYAARQLRSRSAR